MLTLDRVCLCPPRATPSCPETGKDCERAAVIEGKPRGRLFWLSVGVFAERRERNYATVCWRQPPSPMAAMSVANVGDQAWTRYSRGRWHSPPGHYQFTCA